MSTQKAYDFLIYGAYGYTGELITQLASKQGLNPLLAGRNAVKLRQVAEKFHFSFSTLELNDEKALAEALNQVPLVLHVAGPYSATAEPMVKACLRHRVHYLDVTGEVDVFEWIASQDEKAKEAGIVLLPGVGFDVVPSDCLALHLKNKLPDATHLNLVIKAIGEMSRGTALTTIEGLGKGSRIRENGALKDIPFGELTQTFNIENKKTEVASVPWGDLATAYRSTRIPNIVTYFPLAGKIKMMVGMAKYLNWMLALSPVQALLKSQIRWMVKGPGERFRESSTALVWGEVRNQKGEKAQAELHTPEGYKLTSYTALQSAIKVLKGNISPGYHTPATAFGPDYILEFDEVKRKDL